MEFVSVLLKAAHSLPAGYRIALTGTLEEKIDEIIERKKEITDSIVGAGEAWLTELSTSELKELFKLRREAVAD